MAEIDERPASCAPDRRSPWVDPTRSRRRRPGFAIASETAPGSSTGADALPAINAAGRHAVLMDAATDAIIVISEKSTIVDVNTAASDMFGFGRDDILGRTSASSRHPRCDRATAAAVDRYRRTGEQRVSWKGVNVTARHRAGGSSRSRSRSASSPSTASSGSSGSSAIPANGLASRASFARHRRWRPSAFSPAGRPRFQQHPGRDRRVHGPCGIDSPS